MAAKKRAVDNRAILQWPPGARPVGVTTRFNRDAIVSHADVTIGDANISAGIGVDAIRVRRIRGADDRDTANVDVVTEHWSDVPEWRVPDRNAFDHHVTAFVRLDKCRPQK